MMNLFSALELGKNSLLAQQQMFQIIGHNIANVNTDGYSRQIACLESVAPAVIGLKSGGQGVNLESIMAVRDRFVLNQIVDREQYSGKYENLSGILRTVESLFDESKGMGLSDQMTEFFNRWSDLANHPDNMANRKSLVNYSQSMTETIRNSYLRLVEQQEIANENISVLTGDINNIATEISELNEKITYANGTGSPAWDLIDRRENKIKELADKIGINVYYNKTTDAATIEIAGAGRPLVVDGQVNELSVVRDPANSNYFNVYIEDGSGSTTEITDRIQNGKMEALIDCRDNKIPAYIDKLDRLAAGLIYSINSLHQQGFALDTVTTGLDFFQESTGAGQVTAIAGTNITFAGLPGNISDTLQAGDIITIGGQTKTVTAVTDPSTITIDSAFNPDPPAALPAAWEYVNVRGSAASIAVNSAVLADASLVAAADAAGAVGNNGMALQIAALVNSKNVVDSDGDGTMDYGTFHDYLGSMYSDIGNDSANATYELEANESMLVFLKNKRDEVSGVSLDEEAADLMRFEKSYQATAQFVGLINRLTDVLINIGRG